MKAKGLGKGLGALIDGASREEQSPENKEYAMIDIQKIDINAGQPRKQFKEEPLDELIASIKQHGIIQPLVLNKSKERYMIIAGERRFRAALMAGMKQVPAVVKDVDPRKMLEMSIIENIQREDLNPIEEANAIQMLMEEYALTQEQVAEQLGKSRSAIANMLRLLGLSQTVKQYLLDGVISSGHARALLALKDPKSIEDATNYVIQHDLSVRKTEEYVKYLLEQKEKTPQSKKLVLRSVELLQAEKELAQAFDTKISIKGAEDKGKIIIEYFSEDQLIKLYDRLMGK